MKNWKTTLGGVLTAVGIFAVKILGKQPITGEDVILAAGVLGIGATAKDHDVTGGTVTQDKKWWQFWK